MPLPPTRLDYFENTYCFSSSAILLEILSLEDGKIALVLDATIFYPQGGGQPFDVGIISNDNGKFEVKEVRMKDGVVHHIGQFISGNFPPNQNVQLQIDVPRREFNARIHSAGHVIDVAMENIGIHLVPTKGYHFPDGY